MAFGQIDPARLEGDALTRWYLRSPADIEAEKRQAANAAYDAFFSRPEDPQSDGGAEAASMPAAASDDTGSTVADLHWRQIGPNRFRGERASQPMPVSGADTNGFQLAAATFPAWGRWPINGCTNCHNPQTGDLLPGSIPGPRPPMFSPRVGSGPGGSSPEPRRDKHPQCEMQERQDRGICAQQPTDRAKAVCNASATDRRSWCDNHEGEIGTPDLKTAYRKDGRRWP